METSSYRQSRRDGRLAAESNRMYGLNGKVIVITGGTGSFGHSFVRYVLDHYKPKALRILSRDELKQWQMSEELQDHPKFGLLRFFLGDIRDYARLCRAFEGADIVIHAAAMKQVPASEYNPFEAIKTNIIGSTNVIDAALETEVGKVIALSTDKASLPINLYGATKLCADKLFTHANNYAGKRKTRFSVVRYGNVIGSRGSVVPLFIRQAKKDGTLTITHKDMTRFWMSVEEAVLFVLSSLLLMQGGELFIPKISSMRVVDLAKAIAPDAKLKFVGTRPGEKLHESLISSDEAFSTYDLGDRYILAPHNLSGWDDSYKGYPEKNRVPDGFAYTSENNPDSLTIPQMRKILKELGYL